MFSFLQWHTPFLASVLLNEHLATTSPASSINQSLRFPEAHQKDGNFGVGVNEWRNFMTKWTLDLLVIMFAYAVGRWQLCVGSAVVLTIGEWQLAKEAKRAQALKEKAEYGDFRDGYELGWDSATVVINNANSGRSNENEGMKTFDKIGMVEMMARYWAGKVGLPNWQGYGKGYGDRHSARELNDADRRRMLKEAWEEYQS
jgi:hypothetical protein